VLNETQVFITDSYYIDYVHDHIRVLCSANADNDIKNTVRLCKRLDPNVKDSSTTLSSLIWRETDMKTFTHLIPRCFHKLVN